MTGLVVTAHYSTGDEATVTGYEVSGFDSSTAGEKTITVTYQGKTAAFKVTVKETEKPVVTLESITISGPNKTEYKIGDKLDLTGLVVIAHYSDGSYQEVTDYEVSGFDSVSYTHLPFWIGNKQQKQHSILWLLQNAVLYVDF